MDLIPVLQLAISTVFDNYNNSERLSKSSRAPAYHLIISYHTQAKTCDRAYMKESMPLS